MLSCIYNSPGGGGGGLYVGSNGGVVKWVCLME